MPGYLIVIGIGYLKMEKMGSKARNNTFIFNGRRLPDDDYRVTVLLISSLVVRIFMIFNLPNIQYCSRKKSGMSSCSNGLKTID